MVAERQYPRLASPPKGSFFLFGVRGVGKSTWARHHFSQAHFIDLLDESRYQTLLGLKGKAPIFRSKRAWLREVGPRQ